MSGDVNEHVALATPDRLSVSVIVHVTFCAAAVVLIAAGVKLNAVSAGAAVSQSAGTRDHPRAVEKTATTMGRRRCLIGSPSDERNVRGKRRFHLSHVHANARNLVP